MEGGGGEEQKVPWKLWGEVYNGLIARSGGELIY
jgi:hypothetical protein